MWLIGNWKVGILLYAAIVLLVGVIVLIVNKFDKSKTTSDILKSIKSDM